MTAIAPARRPRTGSIVLLVIGAVLVLAGPIIGIIAGSLAMIPTSLNISTSAADVRAEATIPLDAGKTIYLLAPVPQLGQIAHEDCTATAPDAEATVAFEPASALNTLVDGTTYESFASITPAGSGDYTVACDTTVPVVTAPPFDLAGIFGPFPWLTLVGVAGLVMVIVGIVRITRA
jgi:hypothetical protein